MLYVISGSDIAKTKDKFDSLLSSLKKKRSGAIVHRLNDLSWDKSRFEELLFSNSLFNEKYIVALNNIFNNKEAKEFFMELIKEVSSSSHIFILLEENLDKKTLNKLEKKSEKVISLDKKEGDASSFNVFSLTDAMGEKRKKDLWILYQKAIFSGLAPEEIFWRLWWMSKSMLVAGRSESASDADMKPFVFSKSKKYYENFGHQEASSLNEEFVELFHESRLGKRDFALGLERIILEL